MKMNLGAWAQWLDDRCRYGDLRWQRMNENTLSWLGVKRQNIEALLWPGLIAAALWTGMPTFKPNQIWGVVVGLAFFVALIWANLKCKTASGDLYVQATLLGALGGGVLTFGPDQAGTGSLVYRHLLIPIVLIVVAALLIGVVIAKELCRPLRMGPGYGTYLQDTELFQVRGTRLPRAKDLLSLCIFIPFSILLQPLQLALPVAIVVLIARPASVQWDALATTGVMASILVLAAMDDRLDSSVRLLMRRFFRNAALGVTLILFALAAARLSGVTYVTTVFDSASGSAILLYFLFAYAIAWWYDYWTERLIGQQLLLLIHPTAGGACSVPYVYTGSPVTQVPLLNRSVELFGLGRFLAFCPNPPPTSTGDRACSYSASSTEEEKTQPHPGPKFFFQAWTYEDVFSVIAASGAPGGAATPLPLQIMQRVSGYLGATGIIAAGLLGTGAWILHQQPKNPELQIKTTHPSTLSLNTLLAKQPNDSPHPAILVAASGGGTRAAVFTAAILEALSKQKGGHIVLGSGVSGGAAALGYYAIHRPDLVSDKPDAWNKYFRVMSLPYIREVIDRSTESRMFVKGRLGILLAESFERHWDSDADHDSFGNLGDFGLITNSTLAGRFDLNLLTADERDHLSLEEASQKYLSRTESDVAGGRLMMTNLNLHCAFNVPGLPYVKVHLPILIDDQSTRIERAAALSANFPPVFSNAAIDVDGQVRYWVTDGGAADNRGLEPVLYAIRDAVENQPQATAQLPTLRVVIIDASGTSTSFAQDRGLGSALGGGAHFADQVNNEISSRLKDIYAAAGQSKNLHFYYVPMPNMLRRSGSFGTHWMLQKYIKVEFESKREKKTPQGKETETKTKTETQTFEGKDVVEALRAAYSGSGHPAHNCLELAGWIKLSPEFATWCQNLREGMAGEGVAIPSSCGEN